MFNILIFRLYFEQPSYSLEAIYATRKKEFGYNHPEYIQVFLKIAVVIQEAHNGKTYREYLIIFDLLLTFLG